MKATSVGLVVLLLVPFTAAGQEPTTAHPNQVKAAFLRNFAHYVTWPTEAFVDDRSPWRIGILGPDPLGEAMETTFKGRTEQGRPFEILRADGVEQMARCQIVFVAYKDAARRRAAVAELQKRPVLTVGDAPGFLQEGGIIRFQTGEHVEFGVNLDVARAASLKIHTKMLEVAQEVVDNGVVRSKR